MPKSTRESLPTLTTNELVRSWDLLGRHCIAVVQATESPQRYDLAARWRRGRNSTIRSVLSQSEMSPVLVVVANVLIQQLSQVFLIQHDHMIQEISKYTANPALRNSVLPGTSECSPNRLAQPASRWRAVFRWKWIYELGVAIRRGVARWQACNMQEMFVNG